MCLHSPIGLKKIKQLRPDLYNLGKMSALDQGFLNARELDIGLYLVEYALKELIR